MAKRMQHCFWCGEELGVGTQYPGDIETCGATECEREARYERQAAQAERRERAEYDDYERY